jgi:translation initiation factor 2 subunit 2
MLGRVYASLIAHNPELTSRTRKKLRPPEVMRVGSTRTAWVNFKEVCDMLGRDMSQVTAFYLAELGTTGAVDGSDRLVLKGRYQPKYIESLLRKYIGEYVTCYMCKSLETELTRDALTRLHFMTCKACGSSRSVAPIRSGYHAVGRGERRKARAAQ